MDHNQSKTIHFLLYDSRSGSTLLSQLLQKDPRIAVSLESEFVIDLIRMEWQSLTKVIFPML